MNDRSTSTSTEHTPLTDTSTLAKRRERRLQQTPEQREARNAKRR